jgi:hypothetical protein
MSQTFIYNKKNGYDEVIFTAGTPLKITVKGAKGNDRSFVYNDQYYYGYGGAGAIFKFNHIANGQPIKIYTYNSGVGKQKLKRVQPFWR